ncbi:MAG TPA: hypothetical protein PLK30_00925 [Blastocatellia bacterium]|nr:hypothetical protein [Blastocatellia bacterium]
MKKSMIRNLSPLFCAGVITLALVVTVTATPNSRKRKEPSQAKSDKTEIEKLVEMTRRASEMAEAAQTEARRAREQSEALRQRLEQTERELDSLRQAINAGGPLLPASVEVSSTTLPTSTQQEQTLPEQKVEDRLVKLEEQSEINTAQIKEHAQTKVETGSRLKLRLFGELIFNTYLNSSESANTDVPIIAFPNSAIAGRKHNNLGATLRQSKIGLAMSGARFGNARLSAEAEFDFWGGSIARTDGDMLGALRIRTASARLDWDRTTLEIGQLEPMISPLTPNSLAAVWIPAMASTGNLWQWRPQITIEHRARLSDSSSLILQGGLMPNFSDISGTPIGVTGGITHEGYPGYEGRIAFRRTLEDERNFELGFGGYGERKAFSFNRRVNSYALTGDWQIPLTKHLTFSGEAYYGQSINLGERSATSVDRLYAATGNVLTPTTEIRGIHTAGGWAQLNIKATRKLEFNLAAGKDDPNNDNIRFGTIGNFTRFKNQAASANFIYFLTQNFEMSLEFRRTLTDYAPGRRANNHFNLAFGYLF